MNQAGGKKSQNRLFKIFPQRAENEKRNVERSDTKVSWGPENRFFRTQERVSNILR